MLVYESTTDFKKKTGKATSDDAKSVEKKVHSVGNFKHKHSVRKEKPSSKIRELAEVYGQHKKIKTKETKLGAAPLREVSAIKTKTSPRPALQKKPKKLAANVEHHKRFHMVNRPLVRRDTPKAGGAILTKAEVHNSPVKPTPTEKDDNNEASQHRSEQPKGLKSVNPQHVGIKNQTATSKGHSSSSKVTELEQPTSKTSKPKTSSKLPLFSQQQSRAVPTLTASPLNTHIPDVQVTEAPATTDTDRGTKVWADNFSHSQLINAIQLFLKELEPSISDKVVDSFTVHLDKTESASAIEILLTELDLTVMDTKYDSTKSLNQATMSHVIGLFLQDVDDSLSAKDTGDRYFSDRKNRATLLNKKHWDSERSLKAFHSLLDEIRPSVTHIMRTVSSAERAMGAQSTKSSRLSLQGIDPIFLKDAVKSFLKSLDPSLSAEAISSFMGNLEDSQVEEAIEAFLDGLGLPLGPVKSEQLDPSLSEKAVGALLEKLDSQQDATLNQSKLEKEHSVEYDKHHSRSIYLYEKRIFQVKPLDPDFSLKAIETFMNDISFFESNYSTVGGRHLERKPQSGKYCVRYVSGASLNSTSFSGHSSPVHQDMLQTLEDTFGRPSFRHSVSCQGVSNEKVKEKLDKRTNKSSSFSYHQWSPAEASQVTKTTTHSLRNPNETKGGSMEVSSEQRKSRKIFKKSSIASVKNLKTSTDIPSLEEYAANQIKSFAESSVQATHGSILSDDYASAVSKHSPPISAKSTMNKSLRNHNKHLGQVKEDYSQLRPITYQPDNSVKYTLVRRHTLSGGDPPIQYEGKHTDDESPRHQLTDILVSPRHDARNKSTQYHRQELAHQNIQTSSDYDLMTGITQFQGDHCIPEYSHNGFVGGEFESTSSTPGSQSYMNKMDKKYEPNISLSVRTMEEDVALRRFFKYHRRMQDSGLSFANASYGQDVLLSESGTGSEFQQSSGESIPVLGEMYRTFDPEMPINHIVTKDTSFPMNKKSAQSHIHNDSLDLSHTKPNSSQVKTREMKKSKKRELQTSAECQTKKEPKSVTTRKVSKRMTDEIEPTHVQFKTMQGNTNQSYSTPAAPEKSKTDPVEIEKKKKLQPIRPKTSLPSEVRTQNMDNHPTLIDDQQAVGSQESGHSYKSSEDPNPSSFYQDTSTIPNSSFSHYQNQPGQDKNMALHSSFMAENSSNVPDSMSSRRPVPSLPSSMEGQLLESLAFLQDKSPSFSSSPSTDDELHSIQNLPLLQEQIIALKESVMVADHDHPSNISSSLMEMSSMAVNKSSSYTLDDDSTLASSPFLVDPSTTLQSSSVGDQPSDNTELNVPHNSSSILVTEESREREKQQNDRYYLSLSPIHKTESLTLPKKKTKTGKKTDGILLTTDGAR